MATAGMDLASVGQLISILAGSQQGGAQTGVQQPAVAPSAQAPTMFGMSPAAFASILGQIAGVVGPGSTGAALGQLGAQMGQSQIMGTAQEKDKQDLIKFLQAQSPDGMDTTNIARDPVTGDITIKASPNKRVMDSTSPTARELEKGQVVSGGGQNGINVPFQQAPAWQGYPQNRSKR